MLHQQQLPADLRRAGHRGNPADRPEFAERRSERPAVATVQNLRSAVLNGRDSRSRYGMMLASTMAAIAMNPTRLGLAHALAMPLGSWDLRVPHGVVLAVTLPYVMEFNYVAEPERFVDVARALGESVDGLPRLAAAARAVSAGRDLARDVGIPRGLSEFGV